LDVITDTENQHLFNEGESDILKKLEEMKEEEKHKQHKYVSCKTMKNNLDEFSYYAASAGW